ncbi:hypothetical protein [Verrucomicrobium sp. BvORR106]|uniref:hypothetical protein n=1 Tax=Verrucomicrobium sp. BvORR106 TaxID=1403819 RepID=UPI000571658F|nr:hypothetical protein [Verrucomicrobium sp. BvORR106]
MTVIKRLGEAAIYVKVTLEEFFNIQAATMPHQLPIPSAVHNGQALLEAIQREYQQKKIKDGAASIYLQLLDA